MKDTDKKQFATILNRTAALYDKAIDVEVMRVYFNALSAWPIEQVSKALQDHIQSVERGRFMPKPADVIANLPEPPAAPQLQHKASMEWCDNTQALMDKYLPADRFNEVFSK